VLGHILADLVEETGTQNMEAPADIESDDQRAVGIDDRLKERNGRSDIVCHYRKPVLRSAMSPYVVFTRRWSSGATAEGSILSKLFSPGHYPQRLPFRLLETPHTSRLIPCWKTHA
jgi:hypothetical protein